MRTKRMMYVYPIAAAGLAAIALLPAVIPASAHGNSAGPGPVRARITGRVIPGSASAAATSPAPSGLPSKKQQIKVLTAALAKMRKNYEKLAQFTPGVADVFDYGVGNLWRKGIDGAGTTIAVIEGWDLKGINQIVAGFDQPLGLPNPQIRTIFPAGKLPAKCPPGMVALGSYGSCDAWGGELALDVVTVHLMAPYAKIVISATPADTQENDDAASQVAPPEMMKALEHIAKNHTANVISISDGTGETTYNSPAEISAQNPGELAAAAAGIPVLVATGDCGVVQNLAVANGQCQDTSGTPDTAAWDDSPWITAVGGSVPNFSFTAPKRLGPDPVWHVAGVFSEGAGFSSVFGRPAYQSGVARITRNPMRSVPDITMDAQSGTSEAAPMLAGVLALATQYNHGMNIGPINPALYNVLGPAGARDGIADVVAGNNAVIVNGKVTVPGFTAGRGFDVASGWGTLYAPRFVPSLVAATRSAQQDDAIREQAMAELSALRLNSIRLTRTSTGNFYMLAGGFVPGHPVGMSIGGRFVAKLTANALGDVTYMISPKLLHLRKGMHKLTLGSLLIGEQAHFKTG